MVRRGSGTQATAPRAALGTRKPRRCLPGLPGCVASTNKRERLPAPAAAEGFAPRSPAAAAGQCWGPAQPRASFPVPCSAFGSLHSAQQSALFLPSQAHSTHMFFVFLTQFPKFTHFRMLKLPSARVNHQDWRCPC